MRDIPTRVASKVIEAPNGCWHWTGHISKDGYGKIFVGSREEKNRKAVPVHRFVYEMVIEKLPERRGEPGHRHVDHQCHNDDESCPGGSTCLHRRCVNPDHLRAVPAKTNILAGKGHAARYAVATHCIHGHEFTDSNTYLDRDGHRSCKRCKIDQGRDLRRAKAAVRSKTPHYQKLKTHCPEGHEYSGSNLYVRADGARSCRECVARRNVEFQERKRGGPLPGHQASWTHCKSGHPLSGENLYVAPGSGKRACKQCKVNRRRAHA